LIQLRATNDERYARGAIKRDEYLRAKKAIAERLMNT
jgi:uncharacterized membrane protein